jgi:hypothetical protein
VATSKDERAQTGRTGDGIAEGARVLDDALPASKVSLSCPLPLHLRVRSTANSVRDTDAVWPFVSASTLVLPIPTLEPSMCGAAFRCVHAGQSFDSCPLPLHLRVRSTANSVRDTDAVWLAGTDRVHGTFEAGKAPDNLVRLCVYARFAHSDFGAEHVRRCVPARSARSRSAERAITPRLGFAAEQTTASKTLKSHRRRAKQGIRCHTAPSPRACVCAWRRVLTGG